MDNNLKKLELKRLLIFLAFSFGLTWAYFFAFIFTGWKWNIEDSLSSVIGLGMLFPFIAHILTRLVTKEGFAMTGKDSLMLGISFKNKKWIFYLIAIFLPWIYREISNLITIIIFPEVFDLEFYKEFGISKAITFIYPLIAISSAVVASFAALGEEGGWRGYMMPKLIKLMGYKKAVFVGGVIWGLWHAPLTCIGHNFGTAYPGFPYVGIIYMCIMCTAIGIILTFVTIKSGSIWPATFLHAVNNASASILFFYINSEKYDSLMSSSLAYWSIMMIPIVIFAIICFIITCKSLTKERVN